jgi:glyoxylase-like metal-dependent hydrolase (beta-lactamase superfamily II)
MLTPADAGLKPLDIWADCYRPANAKQRLDRIRSIAPRFKREFVQGQAALAVRTLPTSLAPYPVTYAFNRVCKLRYPYLVFQNRCVVVQFYQNGIPKILLFNPTIPARSAAAPFFARLAGKLPFEQTFRKLVMESKPVPEQLRLLGIRPDEVDYVAFDHQHVQDLRPFLGTPDEPPLYPNAAYLVQRQDWEASVALHPLQQSWWIRDSAERVGTGRLVLLDGDYQLGDGCAILATPGHTYGNQTLLFRAPQTGCYTVSENGVCMDSYAPRHSSIRGLAEHARTTGEEVILNANTLENSLDQYNSMIKEQLCADAYGPDPRFVQHFSSSELIHTPIAPGLRPTRSISAVNEGALLQAKVPSPTS